MAKTVEHVHWPDAPDMWMPYAPAIKVKGGTTIYLAGVTAAPVYHHHPHRPEEFDSMPRDMEGQARAALENLKRGLEAVGATFADVVTADRFVTDLSDQDAFNRVWGEYFRDAKPATTTVQVVRLATDADVDFSTPSDTLPLVAEHPRKVVKLAEQYGVTSSIGRLQKALDGLPAT